jgi:hypothetical protein
MNMRTKGFKLIRIIEKGNMTKTDKILTPEYLDWHAKLTGLPNVLTDKIRSTLYKKYKKETGNEPWQLLEARLLINSKSVVKLGLYLLYLVMMWSLKYADYIIVKKIF